MLCSLALLILFISIEISEGGKPISVARVVVVRVAVGVHIAEVIAVVVIRRTLPPVVGTKRIPSVSNGY